MNALSAANENTSPPTNHIKSKPKLHKRDTDTVLSSLLDSLKPPPSPPESLQSVDPREFDSQWESGYSDNDASPDLVTNKPRRDFWSGSSSSTQNAYVKTSSDTNPVYQTSVGQLESISENNFAVDSDVDDSSEDDGDDNDYIDMDDEDVFDMLRDNSELVIGMLNNNKPSTETADNKNLANTDGHRSENSAEAVDRLPDVPPPIPTTPIPSDDDEPPVKPPPRRESLPKFSASNNNYTGDSYSAPLMNGSINDHSR